MDTLYTLFHNEQNAQMLFTLLVNKIETDTSSTILTTDLDIMRSILSEIMESVYESKNTILTPNDRPNEYIMKLNKCVLDQGIFQFSRLLKPSLPFQQRSQQSSLSNDNVQSLFQDLQQQREIPENKYRQMAERQFETQHKEMNQLAENSSKQKSTILPANELQDMEQSFSNSFIHSNDEKLSEKTFSEVLAEYNQDEKKFADNDEAFSALMDKKLKERTMQFKQNQRSSSLESVTEESSIVLPYSSSDNATDNVPSNSNEHVQPTINSSLESKTVVGLTHTPFPNIQKPKRVIQVETPVFVFAQNISGATEESTFVNAEINPSDFQIQCMQAFLTHPKHIREIEVRSVSITTPSGSPLSSAYISITMPEFSSKTMSTENSLRDALCVLHLDKQNTFANSTTTTFKNTTNAKQTFLKNELVSLPNTLKVFLRSLHQNGQWANVFDEATKADTSVLIEFVITSDVPEQE